MVLRGRSRAYSSALLWDLVRGCSMLTVESGRNHGGAGGLVRSREAWWRYLCSVSRRPGTRTQSYALHDRQLQAREQHVSDVVNCS
ncbi:hypothetical protein BC834DRAFT_590028 [Gloeopeniophorella convolvens]|nr:hypothetical protein BC834DRAFT_590028 [Gloeopeniophorella convolvens]